MDFAAKVTSLAAGPTVPFEICEPDSRRISVGRGAPRFALVVRNLAGRRALASLDELAICEAYMRGDIDVEGDLIAALATRDALSDRRLTIKLWRWLKPLLIGRTRCNPGWIAKHYDAGNLQLMTIDRDYQIYTPGLFEADEDSLELAAERKLQFAFDALGLRPGQRVLDVGCGWGGFIRFCASRGVHVTGLTLSRDQLEHDRRLIVEQRLDATALYQDYFTYTPQAPFDAVSAMGVMEDLSDYPRVLARLQQLVRPGGRAYFDFSAAHVKNGTSSFITKYIWPGRFRAVYMPELFGAIASSPFEVVSLWNDRRNYYLYAVKVHERWMACREEVVRVAGEPLWRMWRLLFAGVADCMSPERDICTAYRLLLERRS